MQQDLLVTYNTKIWKLHRNNSSGKGAINFSIKLREAGAMVFAYLPTFIPFEAVRVSATADLIIVAITTRGALD